MSEKNEPVGRIEVAPEVLTTIVRRAALSVEGVCKMANASAEWGRSFRRATRSDGVVLRMTEDERLLFDIFVLMDPQVNALEASRRLQEAVVEAIDKMVGLAVAGVNVHVEDVVYAEGETQ